MANLSIVKMNTIIQNQVKESCHETSRHMQNNDVIMLLKEEIFEGGTTQRKI